MNPLNIYRREENCTHSIRALGLVGNIAKELGEILLTIL